MQQPDPAWPAENEQQAQQSHQREATGQSGHQQQMQQPARMPDIAAVPRNRSVWSHSMQLPPRRQPSNPFEQPPNPFEQTDVVPRGSNSHLQSGRQGSSVAGGRGGFTGDLQGRQRSADPLQHRHYSADVLQYRSAGHQQWQPPLSVACRSGSGALQQVRRSTRTLSTPLSFQRPSFQTQRHLLTQSSLRPQVPEGQEEWQDLPPAALQLSQQQQLQRAQSQPHWQPPPPPPPPRRRPIRSQSAAVAGRGVPLVGISTAPPAAMSAAGDCPASPIQLASLLGMLDFHPVRGELSDSAAVPATGPQSSDGLPSSRHSTVARASCPGASPEVWWQSACGQVHVLCITLFKNSVHAAVGLLLLRHCCLLQFGQCANLPICGIWRLATLQEGIGVQSGTGAALQQWAASLVKRSEVLTPAVVEASSPHRSPSPFERDASSPIHSGPSAEPRQQHGLHTKAEQPAPTAAHAAAAAERPATLTSTTSWHNLPGGGEDSITAADEADRQPQHPAALSQHSFASAAAPVAAAAAASERAAAPAQSPAAAEAARSQPSAPAMQLAAAGWAASPAGTAEGAVATSAPAPPATSGAGGSATLSALAIESEDMDALICPITFVRLSPFQFRFNPSQQLLIKPCTDLSQQCGC